MLNGCFIAGENKNTVGTRKQKTRGEGPNYICAKCIPGVPKPNLKSFDAEKLIDTSRASRLTFPKASPWNRFPVHVSIINFVECWFFIQIAPDSPRQSFVIRGLWLLLRGLLTAFRRRRKSRVICLWQPPQDRLTSFRFRPSIIVVIYFGVRRSDSPH